MSRQTRSRESGQARAARAGVLGRADPPGARLPRVCRAPLRGLAAHPGGAVEQHSQLGIHSICVEGGGRSGLFINGGSFTEERGVQVLTEHSRFKSTAPCAGRLGADNNKR